MHDTDLKNRIMRRVYVIWAFRNATSPLALKIATPFIFFSFALYHVHCFDVIKNAIISSSSFYDIPKYFYNSFWTTETTEQFIFLGLIAIILAFIWDLFRKRVPSLLLEIK